MAALKDRIIGGFRVLAEIQAGSGSQGTVYKAVCDEDIHGVVPVGTVVALKVMPVQDEGQMQWRRLEKRTRELANLNHPSVVKYHGCFSEQGTFNDVHVVVQEFLDGETLKDRLARNPSGLDVDEALRIARLAIEGLVYTTGAGIVHRDIKPGNIFLCKDGGVKLIDFEIAQQAGGTTTSTAGNIRGSFDYMAPDFTDADFHGDVKSDVFSMGVVLHEMMCGKTPYQRLSGADNRQANFAFLARWSHPSSRGSGSPIHVSSRIRRLLAHADDVFAKSLAPRREDRYPDFQSLLSDLGKIRFRNLRNGSSTYQMLQFIGKGGFGEVFKARLKQTGQLVAVKHLLKDAYAERFRREAKIMKKLVSPCFVRFVDFFSQDIAGGNESFLVMAFLDGMPGSSLRDAIKRAGGAPLDAKSVFVAFERYARGLQAMHEVGIFHRDIKPSNLYFPPDAPQRAAIMDLGIARDVNGTATHGQVPGTLDYMPPEVVLSDNRGDAGMDVYALGLCFYEALSGKTAYPRLPSGTTGYTAFFERSKNGARPSFAALDAKHDADVISLLTEMTNIDPSRRLKDAGSVAMWIAHLFRERFGDALPVDHGVIDEPDTSCQTVTVAPTVTVNAETLATAATQWGPHGINAAMEQERLKVAQRRLERRKRAVAAVLKVAAAVVILSAVTAVAYSSWPALKGNFSKIAEFIANIPFGKSSVAGVAAGPESAVADDSDAVRKEIAKQCFALMREEPVEDRRRRLDEARDLMEENKVNGVFNDIQAKLLEDEINKRQGWIVGMITNSTAKPLSVAGRIVDVGGGELFKFEKELPSHWACSASGYDDIKLPVEFDGRTIVISETELVPRKVAMKLPDIGKDVSCVFDGKVVAGQLDLRPGSYSCRYTRPGYADQPVPFTVEFNKDGELPGPGKWNADAVKVSCPALDDEVTCRVDGVDVAKGSVMLVPGEHVCEYLRTDYELQRISFTVEVLKPRSLPPCGAWKYGAALKALKEAEKAVEANDWHGAEDSLKRAAVAARHNVNLKASLHEAVERGRAEEKRQAEEKRENLRKRRVAFEKEFEGLCADEPVGTRRSRLETALKRVAQEFGAGVISKEQSETMQRAVVERNGWTVGRVANNMRSEVVVAGRAIPPSKSELFTFKDGVPTEWTVSAEGYEDKALSRNLDGQTILISPGDLVPKAVDMVLPKLEENVSCFFDGSLVSGVLKLRPGKYSCRYSRAGCEDQEIAFEVFLGKNGVLPQPGKWLAKPVTVRFKSPGAGVVCKVGQNVVDRDIMLRPRPDNYAVVYERDDFIPQKYEFKVEVGTDRDLPPCDATWQESDGLKALNDAEEYAKKGDWLHADGKLGAAAVKSPGNVARRDKLVELSKKQVDIQKKIEDAKRYFEDETYYSCVEAYHEAFGNGYVLSDDDKSIIAKACNIEMDSQKKMIDYYHAQIGRNPSYELNLDSTMKMRKNLSDWRKELLRE